MKFVVRRSGESFYDRPESFFIRRKLNKFEAGNIYTREKLPPPLALDWIKIKWIKI